MVIDVLPCSVLVGTEPCDECPPEEVGEPLPPPRVVVELSTEDVSPVADDDDCGSLPVLDRVPVDVDLVDSVVDDSVGTLCVVLVGSVVEVVSVASVVDESVADAVEEAMLDSMVDN